MIKALLLLIIATFVWGYQLPLDGDVIVLNDNTINVAIKQHDFLLVEFYASWYSNLNYIQVWTLQRIRTRILIICH